MTTHFGGEPSPQPTLFDTVDSKPDYSMETAAAPATETEHTSEGTSDVITNEVASHGLESGEQPGSSPQETRVADAPLLSQDAPADPSYVDTPPAQESWWKRPKAIWIGAAAASALVVLASIFVSDKDSEQKNKDSLEAVVGDENTPLETPDNFSRLDDQDTAPQGNSNLSEYTEEYTGDGAPPVAEDYSEDSSSEIRGSDFRRGEDYGNFDFTPEYAQSERLKDVLDELYDNVENAFSQLNPGYFDYYYSSTAREHEKYWPRELEQAQNHYDVEVIIDEETLKETRQSNVPGTPLGEARFASFKLTLVVDGEEREPTDIEMVLVRDMVESNPDDPQESQLIEAWVVQQEFHN